MWHCKWEEKNKKCDINFFIIIIIIIIIISQNSLKFMITTNNDNQYDVPPNSLRNPNVGFIMK